LRTPSRDKQSRSEEKKRHQLVKQKLQSGLSSLPEPTQSYALVLPELPQEEPKQESQEEDMEDVLQRKQDQAKQVKEEALKKRSQAIQKSLPRPSMLNLDMNNRLPNNTTDPTVFEMVAQEMMTMLKSDEQLYPLDSAAPKKSNKRKRVNLEDFSMSLLDQARDLINKEANESFGSQLAFLASETGQSQLSSAWSKVWEDTIFLPTKRAYGSYSAAAPSEKFAALQQQFQIVKEQLLDEGKKAKALENKVALLTDGYQNVANKLANQIEEKHASYAESLSELECFRVLESRENRSIPRRSHSLKLEVDALQAKERELQARYSQLINQRDKIYEMLYPSAEAEEPKRKRQRVD
jgi:pre-mRNA-splicing factor CDC5/CEF1